MAIYGIGSSNRAILLLPITSTSCSSRAREGERKRPPIFISTNPSNINLLSLSNLYLSCSHSPRRFSSAAASTVDVDAGKLAVSVAHSSVVVSVFAQIAGGNVGERQIGVLGRVLPAMARVTPDNAELVGFGRAVSDLGLTASIYDVMVIPPLQRMGIGRMIVQRILRMLTSKGIYDISALCSDKERFFLEACGFGDDILGSTTMMYTKTMYTNLDDRQIIT